MDQRRARDVHRLNSMGLNATAMGAETCRSCGLSRRPVGVGVQGAESVLRCSSSAQLAGVLYCLACHVHLLFSPVPRGQAVG